MNRPRERRPRIDREHIEAVALMKMVRMHEGRHPELKWLHHVPNGGARSKAAAGKLKAEGVRPGVLDYCIPVRRGQCPGLVLELKAVGGRLSPEQREWAAHYRAQGWEVVVAYGWADAWRAIIEYVRRAE